MAFDLRKRRRPVHVARGNAYAAARLEEELLRPGANRAIALLQHDQVIANDTGAAVRADINNAFAALFSLSSGTSAPATTIAYQVWADTTNNLLKQRNAANTGWIVRGTLAETFVLARSSNTIVGVGDFGRVLNCTSTFTQTLTAAATLGDGFYFGIRNNGSGTITIDPNGAETIDGQASINLEPGQSCFIFCNGSGFITVGLNTSRVGEMVFWPGLSIPSSALECDGTAYSRSTFAALFNKLVKSANVTMTIASPCVVTWNAHGLSNNFPVKFSTSGALPTGLTAGRVYWLKSIATNTFEVALTPGGTSINTSGSQSGTHTAVCAPALNGNGDGDGSTTFNVPDMRNASPIGYGAQIISESINAADVSTGGDSFTIQDNVGKWITGMAVVLTTTGGAPAGLTAGVTYYIVRNGTGSVKLASSLANAQNGTVIDITTQGTGVHTLTHTRTTRGLGEMGGEIEHAQSLSELLLHGHASLLADAGASTFYGSGASTTQSSTAADHQRGGNAAANVQNPFGAGRWVIYYQ